MTVTEGPLLSALPTRLAGHGIPAADWCSGDKAPRFVDCLPIPSVLWLHVGYVFFEN